MKKIILVGYMAVGKTTIAQLLSKKIEIEWIDLDKLIEKELRLSVSEIFKQKGEVYFRKVEHELFKECLKSTTDTIISTGGGTPCYANNHLLLKGENTISVYLKASIETVFERLKSEKQHRPLVENQSEAELKEFIAKHLFERSYFYNQATYTIAVDTKTPQAIVEELIALLN
ncbi:shikimate kinase [Flavobacterium sp.]|uniref:shikimate kinase n=1 Tax=Flavobacterium sp. TaxID=239 RepID=UPI0024897890|nr:shikimate kinase [Flavobacterium sp.]MDI1316150.1 shikimate kinase [Flavobacterium sp.]